MNSRNRKSIRLADYNYSSLGDYFITICTYNKFNLLCQIQNGKVELNRLGKIVQNELNNSSELRKDVEIEEFVIMPNHIHFILSIIGESNLKIQKEGFQSTSQTVGAVIRGIKGSSTRKIREIIKNEKQENLLRFLNHSIWQRNYYEHIIRDKDGYENISKYIAENPLYWKKDCFYNQKTFVIS